MTTTKSQPAMFENVGQALHVAFLIMSTDAQQDAPLRKALVQMMEYADDLTENQAQWLDQLRGIGAEKTGTVNFSGMTGVEVRAQCALIVSAVQSRLPDVEKWFVHAKYGQMARLGTSAAERHREARQYVEELGNRWKGQGEYHQAMIDNLAQCRKEKQGVAQAERDVARAERQLRQALLALVDAEKKLEGFGHHSALPLASQRIEAIQNLSSWLSDSFPAIGTMAMDCLLAKAFCNHKRSSISFRDLAASFGSNHMLYARAFPLIKDHLRRIETQVLCRLHPPFAEQGIVAPLQKSA